MNPENPPADPRNITTLRCDHCGAPPFAVEPGSENLRQGDLFTIVRGQRARTWCWNCWRKQYAAQEPNL